MGHPIAHRNEAPFPEALAERFIRSFVPPGGRVLDPFCGSGTTLAVAKKLGRTGVGIDVRQSEIDNTLERLADIQA
jgi:DNA modification methylase